MANRCFSRLQNLLLVEIAKLDADCRLVLPTQPSIAITRFLSPRTRLNGSGEFSIDRMSARRCT